MHIDTVLDTWNEWAAAHLKPATVSLYHRFAAQLFDHSQVTQLPDLSRPHVEAWKIYEMKQCAPRSVNNKVRQAHSVVKWAMEYFEVAMRDPFVGVRKCRETKRPPKYLTEEQVYLLLDGAWCHSTNAYLGFALSIYAGLRKGEVSFARWEWIDWGRNCILIQPVYSERGDLLWEPKNQGSAGETPLHPRLHKILDTYKRPDGWMLAPDKAVTSDYRYRYDWKRSFQTVVDGAGLPWVTPHVLRHTLASNMARSGYTMRQIQAVLRHSDPRSTSVYAHLEGAAVDMSRVMHS